MMKRRVAAVIPAFNEAERIGGTVKSLRDGFLPAVAAHLAPDSSLELVIAVMDDASSDDTAVRADAAGADVVCKLSQRTGKGGALWLGCQSQTADYYLLLDGDLGPSTANAPQLLVPLLCEEADMTIAVLPHQRRGGGTGMVVRLARDGIRRLTGLEMAAPLSGQRALTRGTLKKLRPFADGFGVEVAMTVDAHRSGCIIREMPVDLQHRVTGGDPASRLHRLRQYFEVRAALRRVAHCDR